MAIKYKPQLNIINPDTLESEVMNMINKYCDTYNINIYDYNTRVNIKHNEVNNILRFCYNSIFKPDKKLFNNQASLIDYDNTDQLQVVVDVFINICMFFNKALGLFSFGIFSGIAWSTLQIWVGPEGEKRNPERSRLMKSIQEYNKGALISNLKDTPVGALAVANNDVETGLNWSKNNAPQVINNTAYFIPSERQNRLSLEGFEASEPVEIIGKTGEPVE